VEIQDPDLAESCQRLEEALESLDDVCSVSTNLGAIDESTKLE
jgi:transcriptional/translational regulatory protein YebC/TACO1